MTEDVIRNLIISRIEGSIDVKKSLMTQKSALEKISKVVNWCLTAISSGGTIFLAGNGGSFADSQHITAEFTSRFLFDRNPMPAITLGTNNSSISAIGNDYGYEYVFSRELESLGKENDVFIPISTSGNSLNILSAVAVAQENKMHIMGLTGKDGGDLAKACECIHVPTDETARIQESHILIGHIICEIVEKIHFDNEL